MSRAYLCYSRDVINAATDYYYPSAVTNNNNSLVSDIVTTLVQAINGSSTTGTTVKGGTTGIGNNLNGSVPFANIADPNKTTTDNKPRAYLNILFFDERFNFVEENSSTVRVSQSGDGASPLVLVNIKAPKNGFAYVYISNENDQPVYFDNFNVGLNRGRIIEEDHYYPFGLKIVAISSQKLGDSNEGMLDNKNLYNDKELIDDADLDWYDYGFRSYDVQIGRFTQLDPLSDEYSFCSPYAYAINDPITFVDVEGLGPGNWLKGITKAGTVFSGTQELGEVVVTSTAKVVTKSVGTAWSIGSIATKVGSAIKQGAQNLGNNINNGFWSGDDQQGLITSSTPEYRKESPVGAFIHQLAYNVEDAFGFNALDNAVVNIGSDVKSGNFRAGQYLDATKAIFDIGVSFGGERIGGLRGMKGGLAEARALGIAGEDAVGVGAKTRIPSLTGTAKYRIPDQLTGTTLSEIKNVGHQSLTKQLMDFHLYSQITERQFILYTRPNTTFSKQLQNLINNGSIINKPIPFK